MTIDTSIATSTSRKRLSTRVNRHFRRVGNDFRRVNRHFRHVGNDLRRVDRDFRHVDRDFRHVDRRFRRVDRRFRHVQSLPPAPPTPSPRPPSPQALCIHRISRSEQRTRVPVSLANESPPPGLPPNRGEENAGPNREDGAHRTLPQPRILRRDTHATFSPPPDSGGGRVGTSLARSIDRECPREMR